MNAGVSGLNANANKLATISDNIANSQTYGYKRSDVDFASMTVSDGSAPNTAGGGRWFTAGGVRTNAIWDIEAKGALTTTANPTDIALTGRGMLPVTAIASVGQNQTDMPFMLTSTGSFLPDANGYLRTPSGLVLMGWQADLNGNIPSQPRDSAAGLQPIQINRSSFAAQPT
jgi:flagellar hook protein FlgE